MTALPTGVFASWTVTALKSSLLKALQTDTLGTELRLCFYGATTNGWDQIGDGILEWKSRGNGKVVAVIGTDHALTDPDCLDQLTRDGLEVRLMVSYAGVFHPKLFWLRSKSHHRIWIGSNNLTEDGLLYNIEVASLIEFDSKETPLDAWYTGILDSTQIATPSLIASYRRERDEYGKKLAKLGSFTWSARGISRRIRRRQRPRKRQSKAAEILVPETGDLVVEIMNKETGPGGKQVQIPLESASAFFGLPATKGSTTSIHLENVPSGRPRILKMSVFSNSTTRLSLRELEYRHRPCVCLFRRKDDGYQYEIVPRSIDPVRYAELLSKCHQPTRSGSRHFGII